MALAMLATMAITKQLSQLSNSRTISVLSRI
jgi:hypothetical protein